MTWVPVCPEVEMGLPTPRELIHPEGDSEEPRLVSIKTCEDLTERMKAWARQQVEEFAEVGLLGPNYLPNAWWVRRKGR